MEKEEILAKSRASVDEYEQFYRSRSGLWMAVAILFISLILAVIRAMREQSIADLGVVSDAALATQNIYLYTKTKARFTLSVGIISIVSGLFCFIVFCIGI